MFRKDLSRRGMMKGALKAGAYSAPVILTAATAHGVGAVSPPPVSSGTVTFLHSGIAQGSGFAPNLPFLLIVFNPPQSGLYLWQAVMTDAGGGFTVDTGSPFVGIGAAPAPATVNGGNIFVRVVDTFGGSPTLRACVQRQKRG